VDGRDGVDGVDGVNGTNGTNGVDGAQGPQGEPGPAAVLGTHVSFDGSGLEIRNDPPTTPGDPSTSICADLGPSEEGLLNFLGVPVTFTIENENQRVNVAATILTGRTSDPSDPGNLFLDLCVVDEDGVSWTESTWFGPLSLGGVPTTLVRTFNEENVLPVGRSYSFGVCGCVAAPGGGSGETWEAVQVNVSAQHIQQ
jgi:hypothetical protein